MEKTLTDVTNQLAALNGKQQQSIEATKENTRVGVASVEAIDDLRMETVNVNSSILAVAKAITGMVESQKRSLLDEAEARREGSRKAGVNAFDFSSTNVGGSTTMVGADGGLTGGLGGNFLKFGGVNVLDIMAISATITNITSIIGGLLAAVTELGVAVAKMPVKIVLTVTSTVSRIVKGLTFAASGLLKGFRLLSTVIPNMGWVGRALTPVIKVLEDIGGIASKTLSWASKANKTLGPLFKSAGMFGKLGSIIGKIFYPITVIMTVWETLRGTIEGYQKEGIVGAIEGAVAGFLNGLIGVPLDALKDATAWVADKLGFTAFGTILQEFSFQDLIREWTGKIFDGVKMVFGEIKRFFTETFNVAEVTNKIGGFFVDFLPIQNALDFFGNIKDLFTGNFSTDKLTETLGNFFMAFTPVGFVLKFVTGAKNMIMERFGWGKETEEGFEAVSWGEMFSKLASNIGTSIRNKFEGFVASLSMQLEIIAASIGNRLSDIPYQFQLWIAKNLKFTLPDITVGLPNWLGGGTYTIMPETTISAGGDVEAIQSSLAEKRRQDELIMEQLKAKRDLLKEIGPIPQGVGAQVLKDLDIVTAIPANGTVVVNNNYVNTDNSSHITSNMTPQNMSGVSQTLGIR